MWRARRRASRDRLCGQLCRPSCQLWSLPYLLYHRPWCPTWQQPCRRQLWLRWLPCPTLWPVQTKTPPVSPVLLVSPAWLERTRQTEQRRSGQR